MAGRTRAAAAKSQEPTDKEALEAGAESVETPPEQPNGIFVSTVTGEDGNIGIDVTAFGTARITEAPVFLKKAIALVEERLGVA